MPAKDVDLHEYRCPVPPFVQQETEAYPEFPIPGVLVRQDAREHLVSVPNLPPLLEEPFREYVIAAWRGATSSAGQAYFFVDVRASSQSCLPRRNGPRGSRR